MTAILFTFLLLILISCEGASTFSEAPFIHHHITPQYGHYTVKPKQVDEGTLGIEPRRAFCTYTSSNDNISNTKHHCKVTKTALYSSPLKNDEDYLDLSDDISDDLSLSLQEKTKVVFYRSSLIITSIGCGLSQAINLFQGSGLSVDTITNIEESSSVVLILGLLSTALTIPDYRDVCSGTEPSDGNSAFVLLNKSLPTLSVVATTIKIIVLIVPEISSNSNDIVSNYGDIENLSALNIDKFIFVLFTSAISLREIGYFGTDYKVEAILILILLFISKFTFGFNQIVGLSETACASGIALCLLVLSFGKVFEPLEDDICPNGSSFFKDN